MSETRTYVVPDGNSNNDLATTMALLNNGGMNGANGMWNNPFMYLVWMWLMRWMNNGYGNEDNGCVSRQIQTLQELMQDNHNSDLIMQAIKGNNAAISEFATRTGCDLNAISGAIAGVQNSVQSVAAQLGFSSERVINAVNTGDCNVIQALKDCCCETQKSILTQGYENQLANERQTYAITNSISNLGNQVATGFTTSQFQTQAQTCNLQNAIRDISTANTTLIVAKLDAMLNQALLDKIDALREKNSEQAVVINNAQQSALFGQMINAATTPINSALAGLTKEVSDIQCKLPNTVTLPYSCATAVPTGLVYGAGLYGSGVGYWG